MLCTIVQFKVDNLAGNFLGVVKLDPIACIDIIGFAITNHYLVCAKFGNRIWRTGLEWRGFLYIPGYPIFL